MAKKKAAKASRPATTIVKKGAGPKRSIPESNGGVADSFASRAKGLTDAWAKAKEESTNRSSGPGFSNEELGEGYYPAKVISVKTGVPKDPNKAPYVIFNYLIVGEDCEGEAIATYNDIAANPVSKSGSSPLSRTLDRISRTGYDIPDDPTELVELASTITKDKPLVELHITWSEGKDGKSYQYVNVVRPVTEDDFDSIYEKNNE